MTDQDDASWVQRHIAAFRYQRGHDACMVQGCTGSQPLMWVPTEAEGRELAELETKAAELAERAQAALDSLDRRGYAISDLPAGYPAADHIHWAW